ncbi:hypothetical protein [Streptosporangium carneum]|uniref:Uncharacterized protein n=1 Tax=Streptosporangium carneum TaxID=47481 RepID=A0A9W6I074_9ACTN|nr:hypothetical protein [Streptosporangium carneum]GLK09036.1 hypothetical protein GCM10017600_24420 [Streptosporangium carneum]
MHITRKTWVSAGIVSAILAGGVSVTAAASAGHADRSAGRDADRSATPVPAASPRTDPPATDAPPASQPTSVPPDDSVVSRDVNPDPGQVTTYWTEQRLREANPFPMPEVGSIDEGRVDGSE